MKLVFAILLTAFPATATDLQVTLYNRATLPADQLAAATGVLIRIFRLSQVTLQLERGDLDALDGKLFTYPTPPRPGKAVEAACNARPDITMEIRDSAAPGTPPAILGVSQPLATRGLNVMIFNDRVKRIALQANRPYPAVLAHVIAHEIGHVLLRTHSHAKSGLMSSQWNDQEYNRLANGVLLFSHAESKQLLRTLHRDACASPLLTRTKNGPSDKPTVLAPPPPANR
jgi:hypothetical protein